MANAQPQGLRRPASPSLGKLLSFLQDALLVGVTALFLYAHLSHAVEGKSVSSIFFAADQAVLVTLVLTRRRPKNVTTRAGDWAVAAIGGWLPLAMRPHAVGGGAETLGVLLQMGGVALLVVSLLALGRSFGVVAADRGLKTSSVYGVVRHPVYLSHAVTSVGFIMANFWWPNLVIYAVAATAQIMRIHAEERVLSQTSDYQAYRQQVRWRLIPGVY